jgi:hypothetical protein
MFSRALLIITFTLFCNSSFAGLISLNKNQYLEIDFTVEGNNGIFDSNINRFELWFNYDISAYMDCCFSERIDLFNGKELLSSSQPSWKSNDLVPSGIDFSSFRDGSIDGKIRIHAWYESNFKKSVLLEDFFSWTLDVCDTKLNCKYAENSWIKFGDIKVVTNSIPEPSSLLIFFSSLFLIFSRKKD